MACPLALHSYVRVLLCIHHSRDHAPSRCCWEPASLAASVWSHSFIWGSHPREHKEDTSHSTRRLPLYALQLVRELFGGTVILQDCYTILHPATGAPLVVDIALPELRFAVLLPRPRDAVRNTGAPLGSVCAAVRVARQCGWELVVLPKEVLQPGSISDRSTAAWRKLEDAVREHLRRHAERLLQGPAPDSSGAAA